MKISVLDHGYVELVETWGIGKDGRDLRVEHELGGSYAVDDCDWEVGIIEAARQSTQGSFRGWESYDCTCRFKDRSPREWRELAHETNCAWKVGDKHLLQFLYNHQHSTPFEFAGMVIEVQAPIFVFREWHRHRTQSYNEMSARYAPLPDLYYRPSRENVLDRGYGKTANKQAGSLNENFSAIFMDKWLEWVEDFYRQAEGMYKEALAQGISKELARITMPVGHYSRMRASANLRNWLAFMTLRCDSNAQWEIRQFASAVAQLVEAKFPRTYALWKAEQ